MKIYLFVIDGIPGFRTELELAQSAIEDHYLDRGYSSLDWGREGDERFGAYIWGFGEEPAPHTGQVIWEHDTPATPPATSCRPSELVGPAGAEMSMSIRTARGKAEITRYVPEAQWGQDTVNVAVLQFATSAGVDLADHFSKRGNR